MRTGILLAPAAFFLLIAGCASSSPDRPVHFGRVNVATYDATPRAPTARLEVYHAKEDCPSNMRAIALLTCEGAAHEEGAMVNAIVARARSIGADALLMLDPDELGRRVEWRDTRIPTHRGILAHDGFDAPNANLAIAYPWFEAPDRRVFRAHALVHGSPR